MGDGALDKLLEAVQQDLRQKGYSETAIQHATMPCNMDEFEDEDAFGITFNDKGITIALWLTVEEGVIRKASFSADKEDGITACGSMLTRLVAGKNPAQAGELTVGDLLEALESLPESEHAAADLAIEALTLALADYASSSQPQA